MKSTKKKLAKLVLCFAAVLMFMNAVPAQVPGLQDISATEAAKAKVKISAKKLRLVKGRSKTLKVTGTKRKVTWSVRNEKVAVVSKKGRVTAKGRGTTTVTAKVGKKKYTCKVTVESPYLNKTSVTLKKGKKTTLKLKGTKQKVTWKTSRKRVATVSARGTVEAKGLGKATITAKVGGKSFSCRVTVSKKGAPAPKDKIEIKENKIQLVEGETREIKVSSNCAKLWRRDNTPSVATSKWLSASKGVFTLRITADKPGTATITVRNKEEKPTLSKDITIEVIKKPESAYSDEEIRAGYALRHIFNLCKNNKTFRIEDIGYYTEEGQNFVVLDYSAENGYGDRVYRNVTVGTEEKYVESKGYLLVHKNYPKLISVFKHPQPRYTKDMEPLDQSEVLRHANTYAIEGMGHYTPKDMSDWLEEDDDANELKIKK